MVEVISTLYAAVFVIGIYGIVTSKALMKKLILLNISQTGLIMLYVALGYRSGGLAPLYKEGFDNFVDPLPQVLMLTAIVVGIAVSVVGISIIGKLTRHQNKSERLMRRPPNGCPVAIL